MCKPPKKHKLYLVTPNGNKYELGFLSPCNDGVVLGVTQIDEVETSHLTILNKEEKIASHITSQAQPSICEYFPAINKREIAERLKKTVQESIIFPIPEGQMTGRVFYVTQKLLDWLDSLIDALYQKEIARNEVAHILNFQRLKKKLPQLVSKLENSPSSFFGICRVIDVLRNPSITFGISDTKTFIIPFENRLYGIAPSLILGFSFTPNLYAKETLNPLEEIYRGLGLPQYMAGIQNKRFIEKLLAREEPDHF
jgi:hypothetical protein